MIATTKNNAWIVLANDYQARLLSVGRTSTGHCQLSEIDVVDSPLPQLDQERQLAFQRYPNYRYSYADNLNTINEERRRFAKLFARWIDRLVDEHKIKRVTVFSPPRLIGFLREHLSDKHCDQIDLRTENLSHLPDSSLRQHKAIVRLLDERPSTGTLSQVTTHQTQSQMRTRRTHLTTRTDQAVPTHS